MLGERIKKIRTDKNLTQKAFAKSLSTSSGHISDIENGKKVPGGELLQSLLRVYGINMNWVLSGDGEAYIGKPVAAPSSSDKAAVIDMEHMDLVKKFKDKRVAININRHLMELEKLDQEAFKRMEYYIKGAVDNLRMMSDRGVLETPEEQLSEQDEEDQDTG